MYQALYRKYRPRAFSDVTGQEHVSETLRRQIISNRLSHAYLFVGSRGTGKTTCAKILAKAVNCMFPEEGDPCNKCNICIGIDSGAVMDILEIDAASNSGVDNVRALRDEAVYMPTDVGKRVYIIDEVHMLSTAAFNALLKIMEEPPAHLMFILATTELHKVPATILSRCQRFSFKRMQTDSIISRLNYIADKESLTLSDEAAAKLAALADGSMRDAVSLLDQCATVPDIDITVVRDMLGLAGNEEILSLTAKIVNKEIAQSLQLINSLYRDGRDMTSLLNELSAIMRDLLLYKISANSPLLSGAFESDDLSALSEKLSSESLLHYLDVISNTIIAVSRAGNIKTTVEMCIIRMCDVRLSDDRSSLIARIEKLENAAQHSAIQPAQTSQPTQSPSVLPETDTNQVPQATNAAQTTHATQELQIAHSPQPARTSESIIDAKIEPTNTESPVETTPGPTSVDLAQPTSEHAEKAAEISDADVWKEIVGLLDKTEPQAYAVLSNRANISVEISTDKIIIRARDPFTVAQIKNKPVSEPLSKAAESVLKKEMIIMAEVGSDFAATPQLALDDLEKFDVVKVIN